MSREEKFANWQYPEIPEGQPTRYGWLVQHVPNLKLGFRTDIGAYTYINAEYGVVIEDEVQVGSHCSIYSASTIDGKMGEVVLRRNCRIGTHCVVMPGVTVGEGAVIGAFSFVTTDIPENCVAVGVPARVIKTKVKASLPKSRIFLSPPHMSGREIEFVKEAFEDNYIAPVGPMIDAFEREFCEKVAIPYAVAVSSGTAAMHLAMRNLGVSAGDEVFVSDLTFIGSVTPALMQGATPVFIDSDRTTWNMDPELLAAELARCEKAGSLPKAVVPTDLYGQCCDVARIAEICRAYAVPFVIDSAEALGATCNGSPAGTGAAASVYSFNGNKIITTSGGGMLASRDRQFIERARFLSQQARDPFPHYEHSEIGYNYRMSTIVAAIGRGQLTVLDGRVKRKREIFDYYREALGGLPGIEFMPEAPYGTSNRWLTVILIDEEEFGVDREVVRVALEAENIEARPVWKPMHMQPVFELRGERKSGMRMASSRIPGENHSRSGHTPSNGISSARYAARMVGGAVSEDLFARGLCLPSGTQMTPDDLELVVKTVLTARKSVSGRFRKCSA